MPASTGNSSKTKVWKVDSGATQHILTDKTGFTSPIGGPTKSVALADDYCLDAKGMGVATGVTRVRAQLNVADTLCVLSMAHNLFSVRAVCKRGGTVVLAGDRVFVYKDGRAEAVGGALVAEGHAKVDDEYELDLTADADAVAAAATYKQGHGAAQLWHRRLCHLVIDNLRRLVPLVTDMDISADAVERTNMTCHPCVKAHMERMPLQSVTRVTKKLGLIHIEVGEPMNPARDGCKYFMGMRDNKTAYAIVSLLRFKDGARDAFKSWILNLQTQTGLKVKRV
eukprot:TRINITY_DN1892_c0_g1_i4.p2 TRINITY_DN1892_c0_g1~~TRINITY_DN1892_c0_g1_i4.p2  ORF type:complete len:282 (+),score=50.04 TRINITY_DN1892_c0_g1_i4:1222-2067(+)